MTSTRRNTWQRAAVRDLLSGSDEFKTAQQVHAELREVGDKVGLATVYRALQSMADGGEVDVVRNPEGEASYRFCSPGHHHHLVCRNCAFTVEIEADAVERWTHHVAQQHGFTDEGHELEIFGLCARCSAEAEASALEEG
ncbi:Fur family transcriptional regulator [uncultured Tessaracoccus sp.]|uniref:Fur family transcriptional regulator n=1 Tax=uncultured Tessaracoccus sp. TaxID=905023 RepID=UPI0025ED8357|nr:transcriptional repressor [uncultured Tessaracoccus sp.]